MSTNAMKSACILSAKGCPRSEFEQSKLINYFEMNGWEIEQDFRKADYVFVGSCKVNERAERISLWHLNCIQKEMKKDAIMMALGCNGGKIINNNLDIDCIGINDFDRFDDILGSKTHYENIKEPANSNKLVRLTGKEYGFWNKISTNFPFSIIMSLNIFNNKSTDKRILKRKKHYQIKVSEGCNGECTFCAIKFGIGKYISKPLETIEKEFVDALNSGHKEISLISADVGAYGCDIGLNISILLETLFKHDGDFVLYIHDFNPEYLIQYFSELFTTFKNNSNRIGYLGLPFQSGSDKILMLMKRRYSVREMESSFLKLVNEIPNLQLKTHVMVGFPGENEADFKRTCQFIRRIPFFQIFLYVYSDREGTESSNFPNKVPLVVKYIRLYRIRLLKLRMRLFKSSAENNFNPSDRKPSSVIKKALDVLYEDEP